MNAITEWISANPGVTLAMFAGAIFAIGVFEVMHRHAKQLGVQLTGAVQSMESVPQKFEHTFRHVIEVVEGKKPVGSGTAAPEGLVLSESVHAAPGAAMKDAGEKLAAARDAAFGSQAPAKSDAPPSYTSSADGFMWEAYLHDTAPDLEARAEMIKSFASAFPDKQPAEIVTLWRQSQVNLDVSQKLMDAGVLAHVLAAGTSPTDDAASSEPLPHVENTNGVLDAFDDLVRQGCVQAAYYHVTIREWRELEKRAQPNGLQTVEANFVHIANTLAAPPPGYVGSAAEALRERA